MVPHGVLSLDSFLPVAAGAQQFKKQSCGERDTGRLVNVGSYRDFFPYLSHGTDFWTRLMGGSTD
jgi:hypothetical protein